MDKKTLSLGGVGGTVASQPNGLERTIFLPRSFYTTSLDKIDSRAFGAVSINSD